MSLSECYTRGELDTAWGGYIERLACEPGFIDSPDCSALTFAALTRMRRNVDLIVEHLRAAGYRFACEAVGAPPRRATPQAMITLMRRAGAPYAVTAVAEIVGTVDLRHAADAPLETLATLGGWDPLVFNPDYFAADYADAGWREMRAEVSPGCLPLSFAPDALHKAGISGGEGYAICLPAEGPDPQVAGLGISFLTYMRQVIGQGGVFGLTAPLMPDQPGWADAVPVPGDAPGNATLGNTEGRRLPDSALLNGIRAALQPF